MSLIRCPECGKEFSDRAVACPNCGFPIEEIRESEGSKNSGDLSEESSISPARTDSTYAGESNVSGSSIHDNTSSAAMDSQHSDTTLKGNNKTIVGIGIAVLLVIMSIFLILSFGSSKPAVDAELQGIWVYSTYMGGYTVGHGYRFKDGRFDEFSHIDYEVLSNAGIRSGDYKIHGNSITLKYDDKERGTATLSFDYEGGTLKLWKKDEDGDIFNYIKAD